MDIVNLSWNEAFAKRFNHPLLPRSIRGLIVGKSGCGKTTLLLNLLLRPDWLDYNNLCVFGSQRNTIYSFFPNVSPGYKIIENPVNLVYLPLTLNEIHNLNVSITDQDGTLLNLRGENLTIRFHIREAR